ncbi:translation initiation factor IF-2-like isoform X8 [Oenanthe melanoleuca]|uniref:translation initiation factor IF-2-like isoform X8 n=1 Tax=Oenanthe melanoleuca TaxID=2939378 RepID=UPI0024C1B5E7|nr:translation initiation factor IF-2-like isoform X8 [Oenanthe melanoleuca]
MEGAPRGPECGAALLARSRRSRSGSAGPVRCWEQQNHRAGQGWCRSGARSSRTIGQGRSGLVQGTAEPSGRAGLVPVRCREQQNHRAGPVRSGAGNSRTIGQGWCRSGAGNSRTIGQGRAGAGPVPGAAGPIGQGRAGAGPVPGAAEPSGRAGLVPVRCPEQQNHRAGQGWGAEGWRREELTSASTRGCQPYSAFAE